jgi:hypothetical protein
MERLRLPKTIQVITLEESKGGFMELSERQIKQIVRVIMPELYEMQAGCDKWYDIIAELCRESESGSTSEQQEA